MPASAEPRNEGGNLNLLDERRSAHASIRGYLYQTCLGVLRWLDLQPNEVLLCEGDEDLDRFLLGGGAVSEQVKAYTGGLSITDRAVRDSLRNFLRSYVALRQRGEARKFVFTTTATYEKKRRGGLNFDLLEAWKAGDRRVEVVAEIRSLVEPLEKDSKRAEVEAALMWLDGQSEGWTGFMNAVEWSFAASNLDGIRQTIRSRLSTQAETRILPGEVLLDRLIVRVFEAHIQDEPKDRTLTRKDLSDLIDAARTDIGTWAASPMAARIRAVFDEVGQIKRLLHDNTDRLPPNASPGKLLTAAYEVIPFDENGRREELDLLASWCNGDEQRSVLLLTGEGGSGKTRLMIEWCRRLRHQGWHAGFLRKDRGEGDLDPLLEGSAPRLVVVDYAETRLGVVEPLLLKVGLASDGEGPKFCVVLLARRMADWWDNLSRFDRAVEDLLLSSPKPQLITALVPMNLFERQQVFKAAVVGFAWQLDRKAPEDLHSPELTRTGFDRALYLHMAALTALQGGQIETAEDALEQTLAHERRFWRSQVENLGLDRPQENLLSKALETAVAAVTLVGGTATLEQTRTLLDRVLNPLPLPPHHQSTVLDLLRDLYQGFGGGKGHYLDPLQPDLLGEQWIAEALDQDAGLLARILDGGSPEQAYSALTVLTRLARRRPDLQRWTGVVLHGRLEQLAEIALDVAVETGDPIGMELARKLEAEASIEVVVRLQKRSEDQKYRHSVPLREVGQVTTERGLTLLRERQTDQDETQQIEYARLANNLGIRLRKLGRREDALAASQEAVEIYRHLAQQRSDAFRPDLATSLNNLGISLSELGRRKDALGVTQEAVEISQQLALQNPDAFLPSLALSFTNLGLGFSGLGRQEDALDATEKAVESYRQLVQKEPGVFLPYLAVILNNLGNVLSELGRQQNALAAAQEAVELYRQLARKRPDTFLSDLAASLNNLGSAFSELGRHKEALEATQEAVEIYRNLADQRPDAFRPSLAISLDNLGSSLSDLGRYEDASLAAEEAVQVLAPFFLRLPAAFGPRMADIVRNYRAQAEAAGKEPDEALLAPIAEAFQSPSPSQDAED
jgi:tetratricopeptide (TPR) repeat protein